MALSPVIGGSGFYNKSSASPPGGSNTEIQFNNAGAFGGSAALTWTGATSLLTSGRLALTGVANSTLLDVSGYSLTGSDATSMISLAGTLNTSGSPNVIYGNITNTASGANTRLIRLDVGAAHRFSVSTSGEIFLGANSPSISDTGSGLLFKAAGGDVAAFQGGGNVALVLFGDNTINFGGFGTNILTRDGANHVLAMRSSTSAQTFRVYGTFTDASNYVRASLGATSTSVTLSAETAGTGADDIDLAITPVGTGRVRYGTFAADVAALVAGTIEIKDSGGTVRKIMIAA